VLLLGFQENPYPYIRRANIYVQASLHEALSTTIVEAMTCERPIVATDCPGGTAELTNFGKYWHLVPVGDDRSLADAMLAALAGDGRKPPADWLDQFKLQVVIQKYLELI
jgi:glycosyltransferase involved in cell wall biosynthesis